MSMWKRALESIDQCTAEEQHGLLAHLGLFVRRVVLSVLALQDGRHVPQAMLVARSAHQLLSVSPDAATCYWRSDVLTCYWRSDVLLVVPRYRQAPVC
jgi:hypothetical protein